MRVKPLSLLLPALLGASHAQALQFGEITVLSRLGQPLKAEVRIFENVEDKRLNAECFALSPGEKSNADASTLARGRVALTRDRDGTRLLIDSDQAVVDPILQLSVRVVCGPLQLRSYSALMNPLALRESVPRSAAANVRRSAVAGEPLRSETSGAEWISAEGESARSIAASIFPSNRSAQSRFLSALLTANPDLGLGAKGEQRLSAGTALRLPDARHLPGASGAPADKPRRAEATLPVYAKAGEQGRAGAARTKQGEVSAAPGGGKALGAPDDLLALRLATKLPPLAPTQASETRRAVLRTEYQLLTAIYDQASQQLKLAEQVRVLDASLSALMAATESISRGAGQPAAAMLAPQQAAPPPLVPVVPAPAAASTTRPSSAPEPNLPPPAVFVPFSPLKVRSAQEVSEEDFGFTDWVLELSTEWWRELAAGFGLLLLLLIWRSVKGWSKGLKPVRNKVIQRDPLSVIEEEIPSRVPRSSKGASLAPAADDKQAWQEQPLASPFSQEDHEFNPVMELAEIMLSFGRVKGAAQALQEYIEKNPNEALQPWMKLLEVYRQGDMREEFEGLSDKLKLHFNVAPADWANTSVRVSSSVTPIDEETASIEQLLNHLPNITQLSRISAEITRTWDSPEGFDYLNSLLRDNRKGERQGFPLATVGELLYLMDILEKRLKHRAP